MSHSYRDLIAWQKSMTLVKDVYLCTRAFPKEEIYGLAAQLRRAAVSVPSNIAEGQGRLSKKEFKQFLAVARGSLLEVETQILIASDLKYLEEDCVKKLEIQTQEVLRIVSALMNSLSG
jgi:four helix bundle protein